MKVELKDICTCENKEMHIEAEIELTSFDSKLGSFPFLKKQPFELHLINQENKRLLIQGETDVILAIPCDRCLTDIPTGIRLSFEKRIPLAERASEEEREDIIEITDAHLDVDKLIYDEILVNWPMKVLCQEACKGICKKCGTNLNQQSCNCEDIELDPRMAAIQDIFNKFKEV